MNTQEALQVLEQAINLATQKGVYSLSDCATILQALQTLKTSEK